MASTYALPLNSGSHLHLNHGNAHTHLHSHSNSHSHSHSRSHSHVHSHTHSPSCGHASPLPDTSPSRANGTWGNGGSVKKMPSNGSIKSSSQSVGNATPYLKAHEHSQTFTGFPNISPLKSMKNRPRGESDLGRPAIRTQTHLSPHRYGISPVQEVHSPSVGPSGNPLRECLSAVLLSLPYLIISLAYPKSSSDQSNISTLRNADLSDDSLPQPVPDDAISDVTPRAQSPLVQACTVTSSTLLLLGLLAKVGVFDKVLDKRKKSYAGANGSTKQRSPTLSREFISRSISKILSVGLPYYGAIQLGGSRFGLVLLTSLSAELSGPGLRYSNRFSGFDWRAILRTRQFSMLAILVGFCYDLFRAESRPYFSKTVGGYLALILSLSLYPPPLTGLGWPLISTPEDADLTLVAGFALTVFAVLASIVLTIPPFLSISTLAWLSCSIASTVAMFSFASPLQSQSQWQVGTAAGCTAIAIWGILFDSPTWITSGTSALLCGLSYFAVLYDKKLKSPRGEHSHSHTHPHIEPHDHLHGSHSALTGLILQRCEPGSIVHSVFLEKDSRRIAYFGMLNLTFMVIQFFYGFVSGSLGLLTDSIHMLFDCAGLAVGLAAAVMSKWPPEARFPYGYGKIGTLSGFANAIFLLLVSVEIILDAFARLWEGYELQRLNELLVVSILGFVVNIVGLTAFGHAHHHGHDHGHSHGHSHGSHDHVDSPVSVTPGSAVSHTHAPAARQHDHHDHDDENMRGIFLHILADALGSFAVIVSTLLIKYHGWYGWDPLASCLISFLIAGSSWPLVVSTGKKLLLSLPDKVEYDVRTTLGDLGDLRGVVGFSVPRFWIQDEGAAHADAHAHAHDHDHDHFHDHVHDHDHSHDQGCDHGYGHDPHMHGEHDHKHDGQPKILGVIHIIASITSDVEDVRERTAQFFKGRGIDAVVHVEREGQGYCWCGQGKGSN
ncbi:cation efflux protein [Patellaria atrata CBS 101060]|uniref:Zinc transporter n=1 Tax=Patellaria atrata CBS 101060 TaxID=1346257 RepID=A0A9P4S4T1_9PEZI|nr:cation efflux protein [Patellaria atrata CBS 101060]